MGQAITTALREAGLTVGGPEGRGADGQGARVVLLAVSDAEIAEAARAVAPGPLVGHLSGAVGLDPLSPHEGFSLHPLVTATPAGARFTGATAAVAGTSERARGVAEELAARLGMTAVVVADDDRAAYHAAASIAANFLVTLEDFAERMARSVGISRSALVPLVRAAVNNWAEHGGAAALTGPIVRGDADTVARQRVAVAERSPADLALFDALVAATQSLAQRARNETGAQT